MANKHDIYVSVDIEADGPTPGVNSMLSLGAAAFVLPSRTPIATFEVNLAPVKGGQQDPDTMKWWSNFPEALEYATTDPKAPDEGITDFVKWVKKLRKESKKGTPVLVTYPTWDYMWVQWYITRFYGKSPFGIGSLDIKTLAMAVLKNDRFRETAKRKMPKHWFYGCGKHTHKALDDAIEQGVLFTNIMGDLLDFKVMP